MDDQPVTGRARARSDAPSHAPSYTPSQAQSTTASHDANTPRRSTFLTPAPLTTEQSRSISPRWRAETLQQQQQEATEEPEFGPPRRAATSFVGGRESHDIGSRRRGRADTSATQAPSIYGFHMEGLHRRSTAISRRSLNGTQGRQSGLGERGNYPTLAGPEPTMQLAQTYENYVSPGYADLNPSYEQPASAKPVWSLAKPLPRVVRAGMVPDRQEILEARNNAEIPAENSHRLGLDVNPTDLEEGRVKFVPNAQVMSAQLKDARTQREANFINNAIAEQQGVDVGLNRRTSRMSGGLARISSQVRRGRGTTSASIHGRPVTPVDDEADDDYTSDHVSEIRSDHHMSALEPAKSRKSHEDHMAAIPEEASRQNSVSTLKPDADEWMAMELDPVEMTEPPTIFDEIHNNHTGWSVIRTQHREFLAEFLAVFLQLSIGFSVDLAHTISNSDNPNYTAWGWGIATTVGIYVSGGISGAHMNPAITFMLWFFRGFPKRKIPEYWLAQVLGAFLAALTAYGLYYDSINNYLAVNNYSADALTQIENAFVTSQRQPYVTQTGAFFNEFFGATTLSAAVLALGDDQNAPPGAGMNAFIIGFLVMLEIFAFSFQTGAALNPSRDFGPRLALLALGYGKKLFTNPYWIISPIIGAFLGIFVGACLYDVFIFTGGESPINYPWTRTKRSFRKSRAKWSRRVLRTEKQAIEDTHWNAQVHAQ